MGAIQHRRPARYRGHHPIPAVVGRDASETSTPTWRRSRLPSCRFTSPCGVAVGRLLMALMTPPGGASPLQNGGRAFEHFHASKAEGLRVQT